MNRLIIAIMGLWLGGAVWTLAQEAGAPPPDRSGPPREERPAADATPLTEAQQAQVGAILSKYFCPERHGTYFGGFYMKDLPAMGKRDYDISTAVTGDSGESFLQLLTPEQRGSITAIPDRQRAALKEIAEVRRAVSVELRRFLGSSLLPEAGSAGKPALGKSGLRAATSDKAKVLALGRRYGELDGEVSWMYATAFASVGRTLTAEQRAAMVKLRNFDGITSAPAYLYSSPMKALPELPGTDSFFGAAN